jgi:death-on-curing protein
MILLPDELDIIALHRLVVDQSGGSHGLRDPGALASSVAQPRMSFGGNELYPTLVDKAVALAFSLTRNHAFIDGNKRISHASLETTLVMNGWQLNADVDEQEQVFLSLAAGTMSRDEFHLWVTTHIEPMGEP